MTVSSSLKNCEIESPPPPHPQMIFINHSSKLGENSEGEKKKKEERLNPCRSSATQTSSLQIVHGFSVEQPSGGMQCAKT